MICPNCQAENRDVAKFCDNCGTPLQVTCSNCGAVNRPGAKFCDNCGQSLADHLEPAGTSTQPPIHERLIPPELAAKLRSALQAGHMKGERRVVTMLFCDVVGSTAASEKLDPEEWTEIMNGAFEHMISPIYHYEGTVARLMGDAVLAFFGAPITHEDDPQRAVLASLEIIEGIQAYRQLVAREWAIDLDTRVGINTGLVVVGGVGSDSRMEYTAMGDAINLAARMEQTAQPGTVQIAEATYKQVAPFFELEELGGVQVKGKAEPVPGYRVLGRKATPGRLRGIEGIDAPLIGREAEKTVLDQTLSNLEKGVGGIIFLVGEAGLGKSRLIQEMRAEIDTSGIKISWCGTASLSYETGQAYGMFQRLFRRLIEAGPEDAADVLRRKIGNVISQAPVPEKDELHRALESLFSLPDATGRPPLEGEAFKAQLFRVMSDYWQGLAQNGIVVLVCDDLHWTDPASVALLQHLFPVMEQSPMLILCAMRPDTGSPGWSARHHAESKFGHRYQELGLKPLASDDSVQLVDALLGITKMPAQLRDRILERTEGNPFFVEEVVRMLVEAGMVVTDDSGGHRWAMIEGDDFDIPENVLALLMARIDRLDEATQQTLQLASVIGRSFYYRILARVAEKTNALDQQLLTLLRAELIRLAAQTPELEYIFRHALTQEAAYQTILLRQRRVFHRQVGEALEALFPGQTEELAGALAHHFFEAREYEWALDYYIKAGDAAFRLHAAAEAIGHYNRASACANKIEAASEQLIHLYSRRGRAFELDNQFDRSLENYQEMMELAAERDDKSLKLASLTAQCVVKATMTPVHNNEQARELGKQAIALATELQDPATEARVLWALLLVEVWGGGNTRKALDYGSRSLELARQEEQKEQLAFTLTNLTNVYWNVDRIEDALEAIQEAQSIWRELDNKPMLADSHTITQWTWMLKGNYRTALAAGDEAARISQSIGNQWNLGSALVTNGGLYLALGEFGRAMEALENSKKPAEEAGLTFFIFAASRHWVELYLMLGTIDRANRLADTLAASLESTVAMFYSWLLSGTVRLKTATGSLEQAEIILDEVFRHLEVENAPILDVIYLVPTKARLDLALGRPENARDILEQMINRNQRAGALFGLTEAMYLYGLVLQSLDEVEQAREILLEAQALAAKLEMRWDHWQILAALAEIEEQLGNHDKSKSRRGQSKEIIDYIASHIGNEDLRLSFLSKPEVQSVTAG